MNGLCWVRQVSLIFIKKRPTSKDALGLVLGLVQLALWTDDNHRYWRVVETVPRDRPEQKSFDRVATSCSNDQHVWLVQLDLERERWRKLE